MSAHTPGPWRIGNIMQYVGYDCTTAGLMVGPVYLSGYEYGQKRCGDLADNVRERMLTDASLISAAPDMYEALKVAPNPHSYENPDDYCAASAEWFLLMRNAALAKAVK